MPTVPEVARIWHDAGVSTIPIATNGTKRPTVEWAPYIGAIPQLGEIDRWWGNGREYGLALICGKVSGNLEMLELEGRVFEDPMAFVLIEEAMAQAGVADKWQMLWNSGYVEESPSGGVHLIYRIADHDVPGNEKVARRPATADELAVNPKDKVRVLAETRGEGGYVIVAPTSGLCHPSGVPWKLTEGSYGKVATLYWATREAIHGAIRLALDRMPPAPRPAPVAQPQISPGPAAPGAGLRPGEDWAARTSWSDILERNGWTFDRRQGEEEFWVRPGKNRRDGHSATVNYAGTDLLKVFSTSVEGLEADETYTKFGALAQLEFGGDMRAAAQSLVSQGFGERTMARTIDQELGVAESVMPMIIEAQYVPDMLFETVVAEETSDTRFYTFDDVGNAMRLWDCPGVKNQFSWVHEEKMFRRWNGKFWEEDFSGALERNMIRITEQMRKQAQADGEDGAELKKWASTSRSAGKLKGAQEIMRSLVGVTRRAAEFDADLRLLNVDNGVLDLNTGQLGPHDPSFRITRMFAASHDPQARAPRFEKFIAEVLPDAEMRSYVQRAMGYSMLGNADQRSLFIIHGPSGTGKSTFMEIMRQVFGTYGATAAPGTFKSRGRDSAPSNDLHDLRGKRFVTTSETAEHTSFDEELLKRLTGRDMMKSRELYQSNQEWSPECVVWLATNHPPKFNSDDGAIWRRVKLVPFLTEFGEDKEIPDLARKIAGTEADGILNWLLEGLVAFLAGGLEEPESVRAATKQLRGQSDPVAQFLDDKVSEGVLEYAEGGRMSTSDLFNMYVEWTRQRSEKALSSRRFSNRLLAYLAQEAVGTHVIWKGIARSSRASVLGTFMTDG